MTLRSRSRVRGPLREHEANAMRTDSRTEPRTDTATSVHLRSPAAALPPAAQALRDAPLLHAIAWLLRESGAGSRVAEAVGALAEAAALVPQTALPLLNALGLDVRMHERTLAAIPPNWLPVVLLLRNGDACLLTARDDRDGLPMCTVLLPGADDPPQAQAAELAFRAPASDIAAEYSGRLLLLHRIDLPVGSRSAAWPTLADAAPPLAAPAPGTAAVPVPGTAAVPAPGTAAVPAVAAATPAALVRASSLAPLVVDLLLDDAGPDLRECQADRQPPATAAIAPTALAAPSAPSVATDPASPGTPTPAAALAAPTEAKPASAKALAASAKASPAPAESMSAPTAVVSELAAKPVTAATPAPAAAAPVARTRPTTRRRAAANDTATGAATVKATGTARRGAAATTAAAEPSAPAPAPAAALALAVASLAPPAPLASTLPHTAPIDLAPEAAGDGLATAVADPALAPAPHTPAPDFAQQLAALAGAARANGAVSAALTEATLRDVSQALVQGENDPAAAGLGSASAGHHTEPPADALSVASADALARRLAAARQRSSAAFTARQWLARWAARQDWPARAHAALRRTYGALRRTRAALCRALALAVARVGTAARHGAAAASAWRLPARQAPAPARPAAPPAPGALAGARSPMLLAHGAAAAAPQRLALAARSAQAALAPTADALWPATMTAGCLVVGLPIAWVPLLPKPQASADWRQWLRRLRQALAVDAEAAARAVSAAATVQRSDGPTLPPTPAAPMAGARPASPASLREPWADFDGLYTSLAPVAPVAPEESAAPVAPAAPFAAADRKPVAAAHGAVATAAEPPGLPTVDCAARAAQCGDAVAPLADFDPGAVASCASATPADDVTRSAEPATAALHPQRRGSRRLH